MKFTVYVLLLVAVCVCLLATEVQARPSEEFLQQKLKEHNEMKEDKNDPAVLAKEERVLRQKQAGNREMYGEVSEEHAKALSNLGKNIYKQGRHAEALEISMDVLSIQETLYADGPTYSFDETKKRRKADYAKYDHEKIYSGLLNVANVAVKMGLREEALYTHLRALNIVIKVHGPQSKEDVRHRAYMHNHGFKEEASDVDEKGYTYTQFMKKWKALIQQRIRERDEQEEEEDEEEGDGFDDEF
jgi:tetratricopeptide (TPR) repeat protein